jgi:hypothetical protein
MLMFGIFTEAQYVRARARRRLPGFGVSYGLLDLDESASEEQIRMFEDISFSFRTSNGTTRMTFRNRFRDVDLVTLRVLSQLYKPDAQLSIQDRAVSHGLTSYEWAEGLLQDFPNANFEASDVLLHLIRLTLPGETFIVEPNGQPLQYIKPPFVVSIAHREPLRFPINHLISARGKRRFRRLALPEGWVKSNAVDGYKVDKISCIHPHTRLLMKNDSRFRVCTRSVFEQTPGVDVLRTMNILNKAYFPSEKLIQGIAAAFHSLKPGGLWIVGRTFEEDLSNHVTFLLRHDDSWEVLERIGKGSEMEEFLALTPNTPRTPR